MKSKPSRVRPPTWEYPGRNTFGAGSFHGRAQRQTTTPKHYCGISKDYCVIWFISRAALTWRSTQSRKLREPYRPSSSAKFTRVRESRALSIWPTCQSGWPRRRHTSQVRAAPTRRRKLHKDLTHGTRSVASRSVAGLSDTRPDERTSLVSNPDCDPSGLDRPYTLCGLASDGRLFPWLATSVLLALGILRNSHRHTAAQPVRRAPPNTRRRRLVSAAATDRMDEWTATLSSFVSRVVYPLRLPHSDHPANPCNLCNHLARPSPTRRGAPAGSSAADATRP